MLSEQLKHNLIEVLNGDEKFYRKFRDNCLSKSSRASESDYLETKKLYLEILQFMTTVTDILSAVPELLIELIDMIRCTREGDKNDAFLRLLEDNWFLAIKTGVLGVVQAMIYYHVHIKKVLTKEKIKEVLELTPDRDGMAEFVQGWIYELQATPVADKKAMQLYQQSAAKKHLRSHYRIGLMIDELRAGDIVSESSTNKDEKALRHYRQAVETENSWMQFKMGSKILRKSKIEKNSTEAARLLNDAQFYLQASARQLNPYAFTLLGDLSLSSDSAIAYMYFKLAIAHCGYLLPLERINTMIMQRTVSDEQVVQCGLNNHSTMTSLLKLKYNQPMKAAYCRYLIEMARLAIGAGDKKEKIEQAKELYNEIIIENSVKRFAILGALFHLEAYFESNVYLFIESIKNAFKALEEGVQHNDALASYEKSLLYKNNICRDIRWIEGHTYGCDHTNHLSLRTEALNQAATLKLQIANDELKEITSVSSASHSDAVACRGLFAPTKRTVADVDPDDESSDEEIVLGQATIKHSKTK